jgi:hypothetical protein
MFIYFILCIYLYVCLIIYLCNVIDSFSSSCVVSLPAASLAVHLPCPSPLQQLAIPLGLQGNRDIILSCDQPGDRFLSYIIPLLSRSFYLSQLWNNRAHPQNEFIHSYYGLQVGGPYAIVVVDCEQRVVEVEEEMKRLCRGLTWMRTAACSTQCSSFAQQKYR